MGDKKIPGFIYVITSSKYPEVAKIGRTRNTGSRLQQANTWSPDRDYYLAYSAFFDDTVKAEQVIHGRLYDRRINGTEWFRVTVREAKQAVKELRDDICGGPRSRWVNAHGDEDLDIELPED